MGDNAAVAVGIGPEFLQGHRAAREQRFERGLGGQSRLHLRTGFVGHGHRRHFDRGKPNMLAVVEQESAAIDRPARRAGAHRCKLAIGFRGCAGLGTRIGCRETGREHD